MKLSTLRIAPIAAMGALLLASWSCGKSDDTTAPDAQPTPVAQATPTPAPVATPAPTPPPVDDPRANLAPGPVMSVKAYLKSVETYHGSQEFRSPQKDNNDVFTVYVGEFVTIDSTQRNQAGQVCRWKRDPIYYWDNFDDMMDIRDSDQPFFFRFLVAQPGVAEVTSKIDGVESNPVYLRAVPKPK
jgi:hypothetical protein